MAYISRRQLEALGEPIGDMSIRDADNRVTYHGGGKDSGGDAPNYTPLANASKESAEIMAQLGREQLAEGKRQYDQNMAIARPIVQAQTGLMNQSLQQGNDYYGYQVGTFRPVEKNLVMEAMGLNADEMNQIYSLQQAEQQRYQDALSGARSGYDAYLADWKTGHPGNYSSGATITDVPVPEAQYGGSYPTGTTSYQVDSGGYGLIYGGADSNTITNQAAIDQANAINANNKAIREQLAAQGNMSGAMSFDDYVKSRGIPGVDNTGSSALMNSLSAGAIDRKANEAAARAIADSQGGYTRSINQALRQARRYGLSAPATAGGQVLAQASNTASMANQARQGKLDEYYNKKVNAANMGKGLAGNAIASYGMGNTAGNSAMGNQMAPGNAYMGAMGQGANTIGQGRSLYQQGLGSILNSQTQMAMNQGGSDPFGGLLGAGANVAMMGKNFGWWGSDRRLKDNIKLVGKDDRTGLNLYEFTYKDDPEATVFRGVMADEVESVMPAAVVYDELGFAAVNYGMLGIEMVEV